MNPELAARLAREHMRPEQMRLHLAELNPNTFEGPSARSRK